MAQTEVSSLECLTLQGCHASGKSQGNLNFFKVRVLSGNFANCQGNLECSVNIGELSGNFDTRFKSSY